MNILYGIFTVVLAVFIYWLYQTVKATNNPDVQIASSLRMSVKRYKNYQRLYDEYHDFMLKHGSNSAASEKKFVEIFKQIDDPDEWCRYQEYRSKLFEKQRQEIIKNY